MRVEGNPPEVSPGGDDVGEDRLSDGKLLALLVVNSELDTRAYNGGPGLRLCYLGSLVH
jgi:hypothetical protein